MTKVQRWVLGIVLVAALIARVDSAIVAQQTKFSPDERGYTRSAYRLLDRGFFSYRSKTGPDAVVTPGYPVFLAGVFGAVRAVAGGAGNVYPLRFVQLAFGMLLIWLIFALTRSYAGAWAGIGAAAFWAAYAPAFTAQNMRITEGVYATLFLASLWLAENSARTALLRTSASAGGLFGISTLVRPLAAPLMVVPFLVEWWQSRGERRRVLVAFGIAAAVFVLVMSPWWVRNVVVLHKFIPLATQGGDPLLRGADPYDQYDHVGASPIKGVPPEKYTDVALKRIADGFRSDPLLWGSWYTVGKWWYLYREGWGAPTLWDHFMHLVVIVFLGGMALVHALWRPRLRWLAWTVVVATAMQLPFIAIPRYAYPLTPLIVVLVAVFLADVWRGDGARWLGGLVGR